MQQISRRYISLETIRKIKKESSTDKTRHFLYKLYFKFAGIQKNECHLTLDECMNLGKFYNKSEVSLKRKWQLIEKALNKGHLFRLLSYQWIFRDPTPHEIIKDELKVDLFRSIDQSCIKTPLDEKYYKYIDKVRILRAYHLTSTKLNLPFNLENEEAIKSSKNLGIDI